MDLALILVAFGFGFAANTVKLPPLVGYLAAGFVMHAFGYDVTEAIELIADIGVLLLLFGIGLKLRLKTLARPAVWAGASIHAGVTTAVIGAFLLGLGAIGLPLAADLSLAEAALVGFAFSFSSTVFAVKALEERGEATSMQGKLAIGMLVVQDIFAVAFLTLTVEEPPSTWAIAVVAGVLIASCHASRLQRHLVDRLLSFDRPRRHAEHRGDWCCRPRAGGTAIEDRWILMADDTIPLPGTDRLAYLDHLGHL